MSAGLSRRRGSVVGGDQPVAGGRVVHKNAWLRGTYGRDGGENGAYRSVGDRVAPLECRLKLEL